MLFRWVQPPQMVFLVSTQDQYGNANLTPVTLGTCVGVTSEDDQSETGYYIAFSIGKRDIPELSARDAYRNLEECPECVIAYPGADLLEEIRATALPFPTGISEFDVTELTPLPSKRVAPAGIQECPVNLEAEVRTTFDLGKHFRLYITEVVGISIDHELARQDAESEEHTGALRVNPLFETAMRIQEGVPPRMLFRQIDMERVFHASDELGPSREWIGSFEGWMEDEVARGRLSRNEMSKILLLAEKWNANPDPKTNHETKMELSRWLRDLTRKPL